MPDLKMPDLNKTFLAGRLTRDPELRYTSANVAFCKCGLAVTRQYRSRDGEKREDVVFVNVTAWEKAAEFIGEHLRKGAPVLVEGRLTMSEWDDKATGAKRRQIEIRADRVQSIEWGERGDKGSEPAPKPQPAQQEIPEDDIPF